MLNLYKTMGKSSASMGKSVAFLQEVQQDGTPGATTIAGHG